MRPLLIDTDPGVDDALAILMCFSDARVRVVALTVCGGNVGLIHTLRNACVLADRAPYAVPVYAGASMPMVGTAPDAAFVHGLDGFGQADLPPPRCTPTALAAALAIIQHADAANGDLEILALGPLTNLALALLLDPTLPQRVRRVTVMGGAVTGCGNITPFAEFNIAVDPEAAQRVFSAWPGCTLVDWEATVRCAPTLAQSEAWLADDSDSARFMHAISRKTLAFKLGLPLDADGTQRWEWADPLAAFVALMDAPSPVERAGIEVLLSGPARGATLLNKRSADHRIATNLDAAAFHQLMQRALRFG